MPRASSELKNGLIRISLSSASDESANMFGPASAAEYVSRERLKNTCNPLTCASTDRRPARINSVQPMMNKDHNQTRDFHEAFCLKRKLDLQHRGTTRQTRKAQCQNGADESRQYDRRRRILSFDWISTQTLRIHAQAQAEGHRPSYFRAGNPWKRYQDRTRTDGVSRRIQNMVPTK